MRRSAEHGRRRGGDTAVRLRAQRGAIALGLLTPLACGPAPAQPMGTTTTVGVPPTSTVPDGPAVGSESGGGTEGLDLPDDCMCTPGEPIDCASDTSVNLCAADCQTTIKTACGALELCADGACAPVSCEPGAKACDDDGAVVTCADDGSGYGNPEPCSRMQGCADGMCGTLCEAAAANPSSEGCSFLALKMDTWTFSVNDGVSIANRSAEFPATVQVFEAIEAGGEEPMGSAFAVDPGDAVVVKWTNTEIDGTSALVSGLSFRVESDVPVTVVQHAPYAPHDAADATLLLPESVLGEQYIIATYPSSEAYPDKLAYFNVIATTDDTTVSWTPTVDTLGGQGVAAIGAGDTGSLTLNRHDTLQVAAPHGEDLTGTWVEADAPISVFAGSECAAIPQGAGSCDPLQLQMIPVTRWAQQYIATRAPVRGGESYHWRVLAAQDDTTVTTAPDQTAGPTVLNRGEWVDIVTAESFIVDADKPILAVQYLESRLVATDAGDPGLVNALAPDAFLSHYTFRMIPAYDSDWVQVVRPIGAPDVIVDGEPVENFVPVGPYEFADVLTNGSVHQAWSDAPFGIYAYGYDPYASYATTLCLRLPAR